LLPQAPLPPQEPQTPKQPQPPQPSQTPPVREVIHAKPAKTADEESKRIAELRNKLAEHETEAARDQLSLAKERFDIEKAIVDKQDELNKADIRTRWDRILDAATEAADKIGAALDQREAMGAVGSQEWKAASKVEERRKKEEAKLADLHRAVRLAPITQEEMDKMTPQQLDEAVKKAKLMKRLGLVVGEKGVPEAMSPEELAKRAAKQGKPLSAEQKEILRRADALEGLRAKRDQAAVAKANIEGADRQAQDQWRKQNLADTAEMKAKLAAIAENTKAGPVT
jgi:hypothetical protein